MGKVTDIRKGQSEQRAVELIDRYGHPSTREMLRALLALAHQQGKVDGGMEIAQSLQQKFDDAREETHV